MKINSIQSFNNQLQPNKQTNFKQLRLNGDAIVKLDQAFCENPGLKEKFIEKIFLPLKKCKVDVVFDGYSTYFREPKDKFYKKVLMVFNNEYRVMHIDGPLAGSREIFRPSSKGIPYTSNFNEEYSLKELEAAKNMALYLQKEEGIEHPLAEVELSEFSKNSPLFQELKELEN